MTSFSVCNFCVWYYPIFLSTLKPLIAYSESISDDSGNVSAFCGLHPLYAGTKSALDIFTGIFNMSQGSIRIRGCESNTCYPGRHAFQGFWSVGHIDHTYYYNGVQRWSFIHCTCDIALHCLSHHSPPPK